MFESFLRTKKISEGNTKILFKTYKTRLTSFETPPGLFKMIDLNNTLNDLVKTNVSIENVTLKAKRNTTKVLRLDSKSFFSIFHPVQLQFGIFSLRTNIRLRII